jgi:hypothetical protein
MTLKSLGLTLLVLVSVSVLPRLRQELRYLAVPDLRQELPVRLVLLVRLVQPVQ